MAVTRRKKRSNSSTLNNTNNNSFTKKLKDKRVSFANSLEQKPLVHNEENSVVRVEEVDNGLVMKKPKKGILKQPPSVKPMNRKSKALMKSSTNHCGQTDEKRRNKKMRNTAEEIGIKQRTNRKVRIVKIQRSTKEALMGLSKKERRDFIRKLESVNKPNYELVRKAKLMWEVIRNTKTAEDKREQFVHELLSMCTGKLARLVYSHSTCRVVQCLIALKKAKIREQIFDELKPEILRMAKSKYANYLVSKMLKYGSKNQRDIVINAFQGHCVDLYRVSHSNNVLENVYNEWATAEQRHSIVAEFYGNEFDFFKKEHNIPNSQLNISTILHNYPEKTQSIMQNLEKLLEKSVLKIPTLKLSLTHKLLLDYLTHCTDEQRKSMIELLKDQLPEICHSNEGSRAALLCVWDANVEYREAIVNSFHGLAIRSSCDEFARRVLFGIFDTVDDTNLVNEVITNEISNSIADLVYHKFGVWVLHYLVHPRDRRVIGKGLTEMLIPGDSNRYTKTVAENRYIALFECVRDNLLTFIKANMRKMLFDKTSSVLVLDTLEVPKSYDLFPREIDHNDLDDCFRAIAAIACDEFIPHSPDGPSHIVQGGCARFVFRKLLQEDPLRPAEHRLSDFLATIPAENLSSWTGMDCGCYALVEMYKSGSKKARTAIRRAISVNMLQNSQLIGAKVLLMYFQLGKEHKQKHAEIEIVYDGQSLQSSTNVRSSTSPRKKKTKKIKI